MKRKAPKPFIRYIDLDYGDNIQPWADVLFELGYSLYEMPIMQTTGVFLSNVPLTQKWLEKNHKRFDIKLYGWKPTEPDEELDNYLW